MENLWLEYRDDMVVRLLVWLTLGLVRPGQPNLDRMEFKSRRDIPLDIPLIIYLRAEYILKSALKGANSGFFL